MCKAVDRTITLTISCCAHPILALLHHCSTNPMTDVALYSFDVKISQIVSWQMYFNVLEWKLEPFLTMLSPPDKLEHRNFHVFGPKIILWCYWDLAPCAQWYPG